MKKAWVSLAILAFLFAVTAPAAVVVAEDIPPIWGPK